MKTERGVEGSFTVRETSSLLSLPRNVEGGERALLMVNATIRTRIHYTVSGTMRTTGASCTASTCLSSSPALPSSPTSSIWRTGRARLSPDGPWDDETTYVGFSLD